jgi:hypothetical protein
VRLLRPAASVLQVFESPITEGCKGRNAGIQTTRSFA